MPSADDLKVHATSTVDFYDLLSLPPTFDQKRLDRAWRFTALKYHPDKVGASDTVAREKFHLANIAYEIFSDASIRALYDNAREARERKKRQDDLFKGKRRKMKEELEGRERAGGTKRAREEDDEERLEREVRRLAEDGMRRRHEREEALKEEVRREQEREAQTVTTHSTTEAHIPQHSFSPERRSSPTNIPEIHRTIKARFLRNPTTSTLSTSTLKTLFSPFGPIENAFLLKDKRARLGSIREKRTVGTGVVVYKSIVGAHAAVEDWPKEQRKQIEKSADGLWEAFEEVAWAEGKEPEWVAGRTTTSQQYQQANRSADQEETKSVTSPSRNGDSPAAEAPSPLPSTPKRNIHDFLNGSTPLSTPGSTTATAPPSSSNGATAGLRKVPSFASFSGTPKSASSPFAGARVGSPSLEELTMIRLRNAEKRRVEVERLEREEVGNA